MLYLHDGPINTLIFYNNRLFSSSIDNKIVEYCLETEQILNIYQGHTGSIHTLHLIEEDNVRLYSISDDNQILVWNID